MRKPAEGGCRDRYESPRLNQKAAVIIQRTASTATQSPTSTTHPNVTSRISTATFSEGTGGVTGSGGVGVILHSTTNG